MEQHDHRDERDPDYSDAIEGEASETPPRGRWRPRRPVELITDAELTPHQRRVKRERIYAILQLSRIPLLLIAMGVWAAWDLWWLAAIIFVISIPLPAIAVVIANEKGTKRDPREQIVYKPAAARAHQARLREQQARGLDPGARPELDPGRRAPDDPDTPPEGTHS